MKKNWTFFFCYHWALSSVYFYLRDSCSWSCPSLSLSINRQWNQNDRCVCSNKSRLSSLQQIPLHAKSYLYEAPFSASLEKHIYGTFVFFYFLLVSASTTCSVVICHCCVCVCSFLLGKLQSAITESLDETPKEVLDDTQTAMLFLPAHDDTDSSIIWEKNTARYNTTMWSFLSSHNACPICNS